jgi:hypothetical protein
MTLRSFPENLMPLPFTRYWLGPRPPSEVVSPGWELEDMDPAQAHPGGSPDSRSMKKPGLRKNQRTVA